MKEDGGSAFPVSAAAQGPNGDIYFPDEGMTLRDYFAAKAMIPFLGDAEFPTLSTRETYMQSILTKLCYEMADAMLEARK